MSRLEEKGATLIEYAIVLPLFFLLIFAVFDLCNFSYRALTLQYGISSAMRQITLVPNASPTFARAAVANAFAKVGVTITNEDLVTLCPIVALGSSCSINQIMVGDQKELMVLRIQKQYRSVFGGFFPVTLRLFAEAVGRNEPA